MSSSAKPRLACDKLLALIAWRLRFKPPTPRTGASTIRETSPDAIGMTSDGFVL
jgi:hypothetical protein